MKQWRVSDVMTTPVVSVRADTGYQQIADLLVVHGLSAVPVVDGDGVRGVVSEVDLLPKLTYPTASPRTRWWTGGDVRRPGGRPETRRAI